MAQDCCRVTLPARNWARQNHCFHGVSPLLEPGLYQSGYREFARRAGERRWNKMYFTGGQGKNEYGYSKHVRIQHRADVCRVVSRREPPYGSLFNRPIRFRAGQQQCSYLSERRLMSDQEYWVNFMRPVGRG